MFYQNKCNKKYKADIVRLTGDPLVDKHLYL